MEGIFMPQHQIWQMLQCAHILNLSIHFHTGNEYCDAVMTVHVSIFLIKELQINMTKLHQQLGFTFIIPLDVVLLMVDFHWKTRPFVQCVNNNLHLINLQKYTPEKNSLWWRHPYLIFIQVSTYQTSIHWPPSATCTYTWYKSLWWIATHSLQTTWISSRCSLLPWS